MSKYKILSRRSSIMGRAITYELESGEVREITAPACAASFEELEKQIEKECAAEGGKAKADEPEPKDDEPPFDPDPPKVEEPKAEKPTTTKRGRKTASK